MSSKILAIDTSSPRGHVAVTEGVRVLFDDTFESQRSHNAQMFGPVKQALLTVEGNLKLIVVGTGPGSYTGVRIGIAAVQGIAWSKNATVIGLPSILAVEAENYIVCGDARRGTYFAAEVTHGRLASKSITVSLEELQQKRSLRSDIPWFTFDDKIPADLTTVSLIKPNALVLAHRASVLVDNEIESLSKEILEPFYLSAPFVTQSKKSLISS